MSSSAPGRSASPPRGPAAAGGNGADGQPLRLGPRARRGRRRRRRRRRPTFTIDVTSGPRWSTRLSIRPTRGGWRNGRASKPVCSLPRKRTTPGWSAWRTSTCTAARPDGPSPKPATTQRTPRRGNFAAGWPTSCSPPTKLATYRSRSDVPRTISGPAAARSPISATGSSPPLSTGRPPASSATPTSPTATPTSPTSARDLPSSASIPMHPDRCGTYPTTPTPAPPGNSPISSIKRPVSPVPDSARCRRCCSVRRRSPTPPCASCWRCSTSSRSRSSSTAARSPPRSPPPHPSSQALADTLATYRRRPTPYSPTRAPQEPAGHH